MNMQEMVEYAVRSTYIQGHQAMAATGTSEGNNFEEWGCRYRTKEGYKCAVGQLIPDDMYVPEMEDVVARDILDERSSAYMLRKAIETTIERELTEEDVNMLSLLQDAHDGVEQGIGRIPYQFRPVFRQRVATTLAIAGDQYSIHIDDEFLEHLDKEES